jgi:hypothetical protein
MRSNFVALTDEEVDPFVRVRKGGCFGPQERLQILSTPNAHREAALVTFEAFSRQFIER